MNHFLCIQDCSAEELRGLLASSATLKQQSRDGSLARKLYGQEIITERHRHRYEFNNHYREIFKKHGMVLAGLSLDETLVEIIEIADHPWFVACQFHPEFTSTRRSPAVLRLHRGRAAGAAGRTAGRSGPAVKLCGFEVGIEHPFFLIAGPCVIESPALAEETAGRLKEVTAELGIPFIYKSSFDKANRTSVDSYRGPGPCLSS